MAEFKKAIETVFKHEGGFVNDPKDPGGATNYGITLATLRRQGDLDSDGFLDGDIDLDGDVDAEDVRQLPREQAEEFYWREWWDRYEYGRIGDQKVATKIFDLAVVSGPSQAHRIAQRACRAAGFDLKADGVLGPVSLNAINRIGPTLLLPLRSEAASFFRVLCAKKSQLSKFQRGWENRAYD